MSGPEQLPKLPGSRRHRLAQRLAGLARALGGGVRRLGRLLKRGWHGLKWVWSRIRRPFRHLHTYYEPWMLSCLMLTAAGALIYGVWVFNWQPAETDLRRALLPAMLITAFVGCLLIIAYSLWRPNARNWLTTPLFLSRLYRPWMLSVLSVLAIAGMFYGFWKLNASNPAAPAPKPQPDSRISLRFEQVELRGRKQGTPFFTILADRVEVGKDDKVTFLKDKQKPHGEFFNLKDWEEDPTGSLSKRRAITWEANEAVFDTIAQNLTMKGAVRIKTDAGDTIATEEMVWNRNDQTLTSNTRTRVHTHQDTYLQSNRLKAETKDKNLTLTGQVFIDMQLNEEKVVDVDKFEH